MSNAKVQKPSRNKNFITAVFLQGSMIVFVTIVGLFLYWFVSRTPSTNSDAERFSKILSMYQQRFWAFMFVGGAIASSVGGLVVVWKDIKGLRYWNLIALVLLVLAFLAMNFFVYHQPYPPCPDPPGCL